MKGDGGGSKKTINETQANEALNEQVDEQINEPDREGTKQLRDE